MQIYAVVDVAPKFNGTLRYDSVTQSHCDMVLEFFKR